MGKRPPLGRSKSDNPRRSDHPAARGGLMPTFHITVRGADREAMADLVRVHGVRVLPQTLDEQGSEYRVDAMADEAIIQRLTDAGYRVERHEDVDEAAREDLQQIGRGNRFAADLAATMRATEKRQ